MDRKEIRKRFSFLFVSFLLELEHKIISLHVVLCMVVYSM